METARRLFAGTAAFSLLALPLLGGEAASTAAAGRGRVLLWIRAGALSGAELDPDPGTTPRLLDLVLSGVTAAELMPSTVVSPPDPSALAAAIFGAPVVEQLEKDLGSPVIKLGPEVKVEEARDPGPGSAEPGGWNHPVVAILAARFGVPPPPGAGEEAAVLRIRAALGEAPEAAPREAMTPALLAAALRALTEGAPLVIACERVVDPSQAEERDRALGEAVQHAADAGAIFLLLSASGGSGPAPSRLTLVARGPGVRRGRIIAEAKPLDSVAATVLGILGVRPHAATSAEGLHVLEK
jgi:hypothetical protein